MTLARFLRRLAMLLLLPLLLSAPPAMAQPGQVLNYRDADLRAFISDVSMATGRMFIVDPRVTGKVTVVSQQPVDNDDLLEVFLATLRVHGFTAVATAGGAYKIVPQDEAMADGTPVDRPAAGDRLVTEVFALRHVDAGTAANLVKPIVHTAGRVVSQRNSNALIVVDYAANMARIRQVMAEVDRDTSQTVPVPLRNTLAADMARMVEALRAGQGDEAIDPDRVTAVAVPGTNSLVLRGDGQAVQRMAALVRQLDGGAVARNDVRVIRLKHAKAEEMLPLLREVSQSITIAPGADGAAPTVSGRSDISITADPGTNALIINAGPDMQRALAAVVAELDIRRPQVLVEAIIVEVSDTAARELGVQYALGGTGKNAIPFTATNFSNSAPNLLAAVGALTVPDDGDGGVSDLLKRSAVESLLGVNGFVGGIAGERNGVLFGVIVNALRRDTDSNVLSTPSILTLDNQKAMISVGQEIPITTGEVVGDDFKNPFRTVARQDVGIKLQVLPQIHEGDSIRLVIEQEASSILGPVSAANSELILNKRELATTVVVDDGDIVVLGGLIQEDEQIRSDRVPLLGDIPLAGHLFRSNKASTVKTNLMVFLRPTIVRDAADVEGVTRRKYDLMRASQMGREPGRVPSLDTFSTEVLGGKAAAPAAAVAP